VYAVDKLFRYVYCNKLTYLLLIIRSVTGEQSVRHLL